MPTLPFKDSLKAIADRDPDFANEILEDAIKALFTGETDEGRLLLRNYVHATIGFSELSRRTGKADKNLMRSLSEKGNPTASNLFEIIKVCMQVEGVSLDPHIIATANSELTL